MVPEVVRAAVARLNERYLLAVDSKDMEAWLACFASDSRYFVQGADNAQADLPLCLMFDDCYERLQDRVTFVNDVWPGAYEDYQTRHFIQPLALSEQPEEPGIYRCAANLQVLSSDLRGRTTIFTTGQYLDLVRVPGGEGIASLVERRVILDTFATPGVVVYPL